MNKIECKCVGDSESGMVVLQCKECNLNPVRHGMYEWGDVANTKVELHKNGSATIIQGDKTIHVDCFGFFRDVVGVFDLAIEAMPESELNTTLYYKSLSTSRSWPVCGWD